MQQRSRETSERRPIEVTRTKIEGEVAAKNATEVTGNVRTKIEGEIKRGCEADNLQDSFSHSIDV
jgi:hypothetical protein